jgi:predicted lipid-binding transport protein (Tim44 family)
LEGSFIDIIIFAAIAGFILFRLYNVLGRRTGHERTQPPPVAVDSSKESKDNVVRLPEREGEEAQLSAAGMDGPLAAGVTQIRLADREFDLDHFLAGARSAFEMILEAFAKGDLEPARPFLADDVYRHFANALAEGEKNGERRETDLISVAKCEALEAGMDGRTAKVTVKFTSEQTDIVKDSEGRIIAGDPGETIEIVDIWTFARDTRSRDPNWQLVATRSPN